MPLNSDRLLGPSEVPLANAEVCKQRLGSALAPLLPPLVQQHGGRPSVQTLCHRSDLKNTRGPPALVAWLKATGVWPARELSLPGRLATLKNLEVAFTSIEAKPAFCQGGSSKKCRQCMATNQRYDMSCTSELHYMSTCHTCNSNAHELHGETRMHTYDTHVVYC